MSNRLDDDITGSNRRSADTDRENPYSDTELADLPDWWSAAIEEFEAHGLRPYKPPQFADGVLKHDVVAELEQEFDVTIRFLCRNPECSSEWQVQIDRDPVGGVDRVRNSDGRTVFEIDSTEFENWIRNEIQQ